MTTPSTEWSIEWTPRARALLDAASALFYERGIAAVGVEAIAERAGTTKKTLYDRFGSKERLVVEYLAARDRVWRELVAARLETVGPEPAARLAAVFDVGAEWAAEHGSKGCSMINAHAEISDPAHPAYGVIAASKAYTLSLLTDIVGERLAPTMMLLHEGALAAGGTGALPAAHATAREAALTLLATTVPDQV